MANAMLLLSSDLPCSYWEYVIRCAAYIFYKIPLVRQPVGLDKLWRSPEEVFYGRGATPSLKHLAAFGTRVVRFIPAELRELKGLNKHWQEAVLMGFDETSANSKQYIYYINLLLNRFLRSRLLRSRCSLLGRSLAS